MNHRAGLCLVGSLWLAMHAVAQVPLQVNYQGRLINGTSLYNGAVSMELMLFTNEVGGIPVYIDSNSTVTVVDGLYSTTLGDQTVLGALMPSLLQSNLYLQVRVNGTALLPRERVSAVAYALVADGVKQGGVTAGMLAAGAVGSNAIASGSIYAPHLANGAVTATKIALGAVGSAQLADGGVQAADIASNAVGLAQLFKDYLSGRIACALMVSTNEVEFDSVETNRPVLFAVPLDSAPIVTVSMDTPSRQAAEETGLAVSDVTSNGFNLIATIPPTGVVITNGNDVRIASLAVINGNPAVAFYNDNEEYYYYARANDSYGLAWGTAIPVCLSTAVYVSCSLAEIGGYPAIAIMVSNDLHFVRATDTNGAAWGPSVAVDTAGLTGWGADLLEVAGNPAIAYQSASQCLYYARASNPAGTAWNTPVQVATNDVEDDLSMAVISNRPAICYHVGAQGDLYYVWANNAVGSSWHTPRAARTNGSVGAGCVMIEADDNAVILYYNSSDQTADVVYSSDADGSFWSGPYVMSSNAASVAMGLCLGDNFHAAAAYFHSGDDTLTYCLSYTGVGSNWRDPVALETHRQRTTDYILSMATVRGAPAIAYWSAPNASMWYGYQEELRYIRSGNPPAESYINWIAIEP